MITLPGSRSLSPNRVSHPSLELLVCHAADGNMKSFARLVSILIPRVRRILRRCGVESKDLGDVTNEVMLRLYLNLRKLDVPGTKLDGWLAKVTVNRANDLLRYNHRSRRLQQEHAPLREPQGHNTMDRLELEQALERVDNRRRRAVFMYLSGYSHDEIGRELGVSSQNSRRIVSDTKKILRSSLCRDPRLKKVD